MLTNIKNKYGDWALVIGSAKGMGKSFCENLAKQGINLVMIDHQAIALNDLSKQIELRFAVKTMPINVDLADNNCTAIIMKKIASIHVRLLIYNAAFSSIKKFTHYTEHELRNFTQVNVVSQLNLAHAFSRRLVEREQSGGILLMSSLAGLFGMSLVAPYAASKAFAWNLAEALHYDLKTDNIAVSACLAGATATETYLDTQANYGLFKPQVQKPDAVVHYALKNLGRKSLYISGFSNRINYFILTRLLPRKLAASLANKTMQKMYRT